MESSRASLELLAHFDSTVASDARPRLRARVGISSVLKWSAAFAVLFFAGCILLQLAYCITTEQALTKAARAGVVEATLPRATRESIFETIKRRLNDDSMSVTELSITIHQNDAPIRRVFQLADGDRLSVTLSLPVTDVLPLWLRAVNFWTSDLQIKARAEQQLPGRFLKASADERR